MARHDDVARRFAHLLDALQLDRAGFVRALDDAVSERSLYSLLNGHRRPSRSLAVLIERTWGYRADYLLRGTGEMWTEAPGSARGAGGEAPLSDDQAAVLRVMSRSPDHARTLKRDLDDAVLWTELWQRTNRMLEEMAAGAERTRRDAADGPFAGAAFADVARVTFGECLDVADAYGQLAAIKYRRRIVHLVTSFITRVADSQAPTLDSDMLEDLLRRAEGVERDLRASEDSQRQELVERAAMPSPLLELQSEKSPETIAGRLLAGAIARVLTGHAGSPGSRVDHGYSG